MESEHPIFQIYLPDTLNRRIISLQQNTRRKQLKLNSIKLYGLYEQSYSSNNGNQRTRLNNSGDDSGSDDTLSGDGHRFDRNTSGSSDFESSGFLRQTRCVLVSLIGIGFSSTAGQDGDGLPTRNLGDGDDTRNQEAQLVGEIMLHYPYSLEERHIPDLSDDSNVWLTFHLDESKKLTLDSIALDHVRLLPEQGSVIILTYDPQSMKYAYILDLPHSGLPSIVVEGFGLRRPTRCCSYFPCLPELSTNDKIQDMYGDYEEDYFKHIDDLEEHTESSFKTFINRSMGIRQVLYKLHLMLKISSGKLSKLALSNLFVMLILDALLGYYFTQYLNQFPYLYSTLHTKVEDLLKILLRLLNWLKGSPAGLKLNAALNSLLWRFFSYHLHLWANYIGILEPILSLILSTVIMIGPIGFTVQIALIKDLLSMATFHVYCLYIYATRLCRVQIIATKSLCRLFLGRKWNPLRRRVDHIKLSKSEMFISALSFTIAIFLAPTVITYYSVFLALRLPVLFVESLLKRIIKLFNTSRIFTWIFMSFHISRTCDEIYLVPITFTPILNYRLKFQCSKDIYFGSGSSIGREILTVLKSIVSGRVLNK